jgi:hypothetical protein
MDAERVTNEFFKYGCQYYIAGRYGVFARLMPVAANLHHHGIEMLLKGALSRSTSPKEMKTRLRHKLDEIWEAFKAMANDAALERFDRAIHELNRFEDIRYPDKLLENGASMMFDVTKAGTAHSFISGTSAPQYKLCLEELDELVAEIFKVASRNPDAFLKTAMLRGDGQEYLARDNAHFK